jgi:two-component system response regulator RegA
MNAEAITMTTQGERVLVVEDDEVFGDVLTRALQRRGFDVTLAASCEEARRRMVESPPAYAVVDLRVGSESGLSLIPLLARAQNPARTVVLTGYGSIATAVEAIKLGAVQYLTKPAEVDEIIAALKLDSAPATDVPLSPRPLSVKRLEWEHIQRVLKENGGNISATARALGIHRRTLQRKLHKKPVTS